MALNCKKNVFRLSFFAVIILPQIIGNVAGQTTSGFQTEPSNTEVRAGEEGRLQCVLEGGRDGYKCFWSRNDQEVTITGRYTWIGDQGMGDCSISITGSNFQLDDGNWACGIPQTSEVSGLKSGLARYTVLSPPNEPTIKVNGELIANGSDIVMSTETETPMRIECWSESGNPAATLSWTLGGMELSGNDTVFFSDSSNKTLTVVRLLTAQYDPSWQDQYLACVATHGAYDQSSIAYGIVRIPQGTSTAELKTWSEGGPMKVPADEMLSVVCTGDGYPPPELKLQRRGSSSDAWQEFLSSDEPTYTYNFTFPAMDGEIQCLASNDYWATSQASPPVQISTITTSNAQVGTIIAIVVVCVVAVVIMGAGVFTCYKKKMCLFKVPDPVENGKKGGKHDGKKNEIADMEKGEIANQVPLLNEVTENHNGNQKTNSALDGTRTEDKVFYATLNLNERGDPVNEVRLTSPVDEQRTQYATIKPRQ